MQHSWSQPRSWDLTQGHVKEEWQSHCSCIAKAYQQGHCSGGRLAAATETMVCLLMQLTAQHGLR